MYVNPALILDNNSSKSDRFHEKDRVLEKKMSSFEKFSNRFFKFEKNSQNLTFFLLERDLFHEIDQISIRIFKNVMFGTPVREFWRLADDRKFSFRTQKFVKILKMAYLKNGLRSAVAIYMAEIRPLLDFAA